MKDSPSFMEALALLFGFLLVVMLLLGAASLIDYFLYGVR